MIAKGAFVGGTDGLDGGLRALVGDVGLEADAEQIKGIESVGELEEFGLGVDTCSTPGLGQPGVADFYAAVVEVQVEEAAGSDDGVGLTVLSFFYRDPRERVAFVFGLKGSFYPGTYIGRREDGKQHVTPDGWVESNGFKCWNMVERERLKTNAGAFENRSLH